MPDLGRTVFKGFENLFVILKGEAVGREYEHVLEGPDIQAPIVDHGADADSVDIVAVSEVRLGNAQLDMGDAGVAARPTDYGNDP